MGDEGLYGVEGWLNADTLNVKGTRLRRISLVVRERWSQL